MTTSPETSPLASSDPVTGSGSPLRIGIGGPVGSGKTALIEALVPLFVDAGRQVGVITNDIYTQEDALHVRRELDGIIDPERPAHRRAR